MKVNVPGLLFIDTPGHETFGNLRSRGSLLCDIAIVVVDAFKGFEPQTIQSLKFLREHKIPFVVGLNKIDKIFNFQSSPNRIISDVIHDQKDKAVKMVIEDQIKNSVTQFAEIGINACPYYKNRDHKNYINIVPISAKTGDGIADLLMLVVQLTQNLMKNRISKKGEFRANVLDVKKVESIGTCLDIILVDGKLKLGDQLVVCTIDGPLVSNVKRIVSSRNSQSSEVEGTSVSLISTQHDLNGVIPGSQVLLVAPGSNKEQLMKSVMSDINSIYKKLAKTGVYVAAKSLGSLESFIEHLGTMKIPISGFCIGSVNKKDITKASVMLERKPEYAIVLAFDAKVTPEAVDAAKELGVSILEDNILYHLSDRFETHLKKHKDSKKQKQQHQLMFPCVLKIDPDCIFKKSDPIIIGVEVAEGQLRVGTQINVAMEGKPVGTVGRVTSIQSNHKDVEVARAGKSVAIKLESNADRKLIYGRHFDHTATLYSAITPESSATVLELCKEELTEEDEKLLRKLENFP